jgi:hypothetical protein
VKGLSCLCDPRNNNYTLYYSALLVFAIIVLLPMNLHFTKLPFYITDVLFAAGFISLFMVARSEKVDYGLQKFIKIPVFEKPSPKPVLENNMSTYSLEHKNMEVQFDSTQDLQEPLDLLSNFIEEISIKHNEKMDLETLDSFRKLNTKLSRLMEIKTND